MHGKQNLFILSFSVYELYAALESAAGAGVVSVEGIPHVVDYSREKGEVFLSLFGA